MFIAACFDPSLILLDPLIASEDQRNKKREKKDLSHFFDSFPAAQRWHRVVAVASL